jgi:DNA-binding ferritin-like protein
MATTTSSFEELRAEAMARAKPELSRKGIQMHQIRGPLREAHNVGDEHRDFATTSLIENWIDGTERRTWFLFEARRREMPSGH